MRIPRNLEFYRCDLALNCGESPLAPLIYFDMVAGEGCYLLRNLRSIAKIGFLRNKRPSNYTFYCYGGRLTNDRC